MKRCIAPILAWALFFNASIPAQSATFEVSPPAVGNQFRGQITLQIGGLTNGEPVIVDQFADFNINSLIDAGEALLIRGLLLDGGVQVIGGVTNINVPFDSDPAPGTITAQLNVYRQTLTHTVGRSVFRLSSPSGRFAPVLVPFAVTNAAAQTIEGVVESSGTNVPFATVVLLGPPDGMYVAGAVADSSGHYSVAAPPGDYMLMTMKPGYVYNTTTAPQVSLGPGATETANLQLMSTTNVISGRVSDAANTNLGLGGLFIMAEAQNGLFAAANTDSNGNYTIFITPGVWSLDMQEEQVAMLGYLRPGEEDSSVDASTGNPSFDIELPRATALIYGTLKTPANAPLPGITIDCDDMASPYSGIGVTDGDGKYCVGVLGGEWNVEPESEDILPTGYTARGTNVSIAAGEAMGVDFTAIPLTARLAGRVVDSANNGISMIELNVAKDQGPHMYTSTDGDGYFSIGVYDGSWRIQLDGEDAADRGIVGPLLEFTVGAGTNITNINMVVQDSAAQVSGWVRRAESSPVSWVNIWAATTLNGTNYTVNGETDGAGNYSLPVFNGTWNIEVEWWTLNQRGLVGPDKRSVTISGANQIVNFTIAELQPLQITSTALSPAKVGEAYSYALAASGGQPPYQWIQQDSLPPGLMLTFEGTIDGTPQTNGTFEIKVQVNDWFGRNTNTSFPLVIEAGQPPSPPSFTLYRRPAANEFEMELIGDPGRTYQFQASSTLTNWVTLQTLTADMTNGMRYFRDTNAPSTFRFYRAVVVP